MITPIKITPVNTSRHLSFKCQSCRLEGEIYLENSVINVDDLGNSEIELDYTCPKCGKKLNDKNGK